MTARQLTIEEVIADVEARGLRPIEAGERVKIAYTGYSVEATVIRPQDRSGWFLVRQESDCEHFDESERPVFKAHADFVVRPDEDLPPGPFESLARLLRGGR